MKTLVTTITGLFASCLLMAAGPSEPENTWQWGSDEVQAKGNWMALESFIKQKKYDEASAKVTWLLTNTPNLNEALYINAIKVYEKREKKEKNNTKKLALQDSTLMLYSKRIEIYGNKAKVLNRQGRVAWKYLSGRKSHNDELFQMYSEIHQLNGAKTYPVNLLNLMQATCTQYVNKKLDKGQVIEVYNALNETFDAKETKTTSQKKLDKIAKYRTVTDQTFAKNVEITCNDIQEQFGAKFAAKPDLKMAKLIVSLSISKKCFKNDVFYAAGELMSSQNASSFGLEKIFGTLYSKKAEYDKALASFEKALTMTDDSAKTAAIHLELAKVNQKKSQYVKAREHALTALTMDANLKEAYSVIGDLYFASAGSCKGANKVQERSVYIAAYNMYIKAGDQASAATAKAQFPSMEEMFTYNLNPGDKMNTGCWINENVTLQKR